MNAQHVQIAQRVLSGEKAAEIAGALGLTAEELSAIRKSRGYRKIESDLADRMLTEAASRLQALADTAVSTLHRMLKIPAKNLVGQNGTERRRADPNLLREQRLACVSILDLAQRISEKKADTELEKSLDKQLLSNVDDDYGS